MFSLIVISHPVMLPREATILQQLFAEGLECFHLRKPEADEQAVRQLLDAIPAVYHPRIALHGFHRLVKEYDIRRLHFTEKHRQTTDAATWSELIEQGFTLSTSVHELTTLQQLPSQFSYTFFSPVFDSISKQEYKGVVEEKFYLDQVYKLVQVIALGGINAGNIERVGAMNFDGAAVLGTIWNEPANAVDNFKILQKEVRRCNHHDQMY